MKIGVEMKNDSNQLDGDQFYNAFINIEQQAVYVAEQDLITWDEPETYKVDDLNIIVV